ncbi:hypothetical protein D3C87_1943560 [compost metagenome]
MPLKKRPTEEVEAMLKDYSAGLTQLEICEKYSISQSAFVRIVRVSRGLEPDASKRKTENKVKKLEKTLKERDREIALLKAILKKN